MPELHIAIVVFSFAKYILQHRAHMRTLPEHALLRAWTFLLYSVFLENSTLHRQATIVTLPSAIMTVHSSFTKKKAFFAKTTLLHRQRRVCQTGQMKLIATLTRLPPCSGHNWPKGVFPTISSNHPTPCELKKSEEVEVESPCRSNMYMRRVRS